MKIKSVYECLLTLSTVLCNTVQNRVKDNKHTDRHKLLAEVKNVITDKSVIRMGIIINQKYDVLAKRLSVKYNKLWLGAEIFLFVLVGIAVDLKYALAAGVVVILLVILALVFRMMGVAVSLVKTKLNKKERLFCMVAYTPKATVQAALGTVPLAMGLSCGEIVLTVAVISILITAPFGAICVDNSYKKLLSK